MGPGLRVLPGRRGLVLQLQKGRRRSCRALVGDVMWSVRETSPQIPGEPRVGDCVEAERAQPSDGPAVEGRFGLGRVAGRRHCLNTEGLYGSRQGRDNRNPGDVVSS